MVALPTDSLAARYSGYLPSCVHLGPWLNSIDPMWTRGKREVVEPDGVWARGSSPGEPAKPSVVLTSLICLMPNVNASAPGAPPR